MAVDSVSTGFSHNALDKQKQHTVGVQSVRVSVSQSTSSSKRRSSRVAVAVVLGAGAVHSGSVSLLVKDSGSLVLSVALAREGRQLVEEQRAVGDVVVGGKGVGKNVGFAGAVDICAVGASATTGGGGAVRGNGAKACSDSAAGSRGGGLEVLLELGRRSGGCGGGSGGRQSVAVAQSGADRGQASAGAVTLNRSALGERLNGSLDSCGLCSVDVDRKLVAGVGKDGTGKSSGVVLGVLNDALSENIVLAALGEIVKLRKFDLNLNSLASSNRLEGLFSERAGSNALEQTEETGFGCWDLSVTGWENVAIRTTLTVRGDGKLVSGCVVQESALVEQLVAGLVVVGESDLDLAVLNLSQRDRKRRVPLLKINGSGAGSGQKGSESGQSKLHLGGYSFYDERCDVFGVVSANGCCSDVMRNGQLVGVDSYLYAFPRILMVSCMALSRNEFTSDDVSPSCSHARLTLDLYDQSGLQ